MRTADLVGPGPEQPTGVVDRTDPSAYGERDVDIPCDAGHQFCESLASLECGADVEVDQFVGSLFGIAAPEGDRIAHFAQFEEIDAFDGFTVFDIEAGDDAFG